VRADATRLVALYRATFAFACHLAREGQVGMGAGPCLNVLNYCIANYFVCGKNVDCVSHLHLNKSKVPFFYRSAGQRYNFLLKILHTKDYEVFVGVYRNLAKISKLTFAKIPMNTRSQPLPNNQARHACAKGAVIGALIGDAAGGVLEFIGRAPTQIEVAHALTMPGGGVFNLAPGQITDDGEMTLALMQALVAENGEYKPNTVAQAYSNWERSRPFDIGIATRSALKLYDDAQINQSSIAELITRQAVMHNANSKANGCLMRATPLAIAACKLNITDTINIAY
jgi:hypothetical protein